MADPEDAAAVRPKVTDREPLSAIQDRLRRETEERARKARRRM